MSALERSQADGASGAQPTRETPDAQQLPLCRHCKQPRDQHAGGGRCIWMYSPYAGAIVNIEASGPDDALCSFCGKDGLLVQGKAGDRLAYICEDCIPIADAIVAAYRKGKGTGPFHAAGKSSAEREPAASPENAHAD